MTGDLQWCVQQLDVAKKELERRNEVLKERLKITESIEVLLKQEKKLQAQADEINKKAYKAWNCARGATKEVWEEALEEFAPWMRNPNF